MPKGEAFAIATQQSHASGHTPAGYGTAEGKREAKKKYPGPKSQYEQSADPSSKSKSSSVDLARLKGFTDEMKKIAGIAPSPLSNVNRMVKPKMATPKYSKVNMGSTPPVDASTASAILPPPATAAGGSYV